MIDMWSQNYPMYVKMFPLTHCSIFCTLHYLKTGKWQIPKNQEKHPGVGKYKISAAEFLRVQIHVAKISCFCPREQI